MATEKRKPTPPATGSALEIAQLQVLQEIEKGVTVIAQRLDGILTELRQMNKKPR
jgi:hypothetical protein